MLDRTIRFKELAVLVCIFYLLKGIFAAAINYSDRVRLVTTYPTPYLSHNQIRSRGNTLLATRGGGSGQVFVRRTSALGPATDARMEVNGNIAAGNTTTDPDTGLLTDSPLLIGTDPNGINPPGIYALNNALYLGSDAQNIFFGHPAYLQDLTISGGLDLLGKILTQTSMTEIDIPAGQCRIVDRKRPEDCNAQTECWTLVPGLCLFDEQLNKQKVQEVWETIEPDNPSDLFNSARADEAWCCQVPNK